MAPFIQTYSTRKRTMLPDNGNDNPAKRQQTTPPDCLHQANNHHTNPPCAQSSKTALHGGGLKGFQNQFGKSLQKSIVQLPKPSICNPSGSAAAKPSKFSAFSKTHPPSNEPSVKDHPAKPKVQGRTVPKEEMRERVMEKVKTRSITASSVAMPSRNLLGKAMSSTAKQLYTSNQQSPLLRLPAELRNTIYELVLGTSKTILIDFETYRCRDKNPNDLNSGKTVTPIFKYRCTVYSKLVSPFQSSLPRKVRQSTGFTLLNGVCRQLYQETAVLPYKLNSFSFKNYTLMWRFLCLEKRLPHAQREAIRCIILPDEEPSESVMEHVLPNLVKVFVHKEDYCRRYRVEVGSNGKRRLEEFWGSV